MANNIYFSAILYLINSLISPILVSGDFFDTISHSILASNRVGGNEASDYPTSDYIKQLYIR